MRGSGGDDSIDDAIDNTPLGEPETSGILDAEFDALFAPVRDSNKRRRLSGGNLTLEEKLARGSDTMPSSPQTLRQSVPKTPAHSGIQAAPSASARPIAPGISTPGSTKASFRSKPRFILSNTQPNTQTPFKADTPAASHAVSPPERRKPAFVLPRSPSPTAAGEDIPAPFSPSSRTLHRRGRRSGVPGYASGGMAAEVRSWILEVGSKREQIIPSRIPEGNIRTADDLSRYLVAARVVQARQTVSGSSGPLAFIQAESVSDSTDEESENRIFHLMVMGVPRSKPDSIEFPTQISGATAVPIRPGDLIGIHRGLAWEIELGEFQGLNAADGLQTIPSGHDETEQRKQRWLVAMEWDLIHAAT